jgi:hypothetical protein
MDDRDKILNSIAQSLGNEDVSHSYARFVIATAKKEEFKMHWCPLLSAVLMGVGAKQVMYLAGGAAGERESWFIVVEWPDGKSGDLHVEGEATVALTNQIREAGVLLRSSTWHLIEGITHVLPLYRR